MPFLVKILCMLYNVDSVFFSADIYCYYVFTLKDRLYPYCTQDRGDLCYAERAAKAWRTPGIGRHCPSMVSTAFWEQLVWRRRRFNKQGGNPLVSQPGTVTSPWLGKVSRVLLASCNLCLLSSLSAKLSRHSLGMVQGMACPRASLPALLLGLMASAQLLCLCISERSPCVGQPGCTPPPAISSIPEDMFSASALALSMNRQQKRYRWDRGVLSSGSILR